MFKNVFGMLCFAIGLASVPYFLKDRLATGSAGGHMHKASPAQVATTKPQTHSQTLLKTSPASYTTGVRKASIPMGRNGHFSSDFRMNGRYINGMVDTGATYVALNVSTARNIGITLGNSDFKYQANTANGIARAAKVNIHTLDIGQISVRNVDAFVLDDKALSGTLIGMSFMSKLKSYRVNHNTLELIN